MHSFVALTCICLSSILLPNLVTSQTSQVTKSFGASGHIGDHFGVPAFNESFDYVIVGGGTAGLALANRLTENGFFSAAVVEAGGFYELDNGNRSEIPGYAASFIGTAPLLKNPLIDWGYQTTYDAGLGRSIFYNSGKTLGGGSARNYMVYDRGTKGSYQLWADRVGNQAYTFDALLPYFQKSVTFSPPNNLIRPANATPGYVPESFGSSGPVQVSYPNHANAFSSWAELALKELGIPDAGDLVSGSLDGYQYIPMAISSQTRSSAETAYLRQALSSQRRLTVYKNTLAKKILFDGQKKATGVLVDTSGVQYLLSATREVILSAGAHRSPQLLMVSGIGPRSALQPLKIPIVAERNGVGQEMWDQPVFGPSYPVNLVTHSKLGDPAFLVSQVNEYNENRTGMLTNTGSDFAAWEKLPGDLRKTLKPTTLQGLATFPKDWPEIQYTLVDSYNSYERDESLDRPPDSKMYAAIVPGLNAPFSRGNVTIRSANTADNPVISANLLNDARDQDVAIAAFKRARQIWKTKAMQKIITGPEAFPGAKVNTDEEILRVIKESAGPIWHAAGTNKMGQGDDPMAVVDSHARVMGVNGLRVVDASTFPILVPCNPHATVYALAEKIAHDILSSA